MTKEEFEKKALANYNTLEEYEDKFLKREICLFYEFRIVVGIVSREINRLYEKAFINKKRYGEMLDAVNNIKALVYDKDTAYNFITMVPEKDLNIILKCIGNDKKRKIFVGILKRLLNYERYSGLSPSELLSKVNELEFVFSLEKNVPDEFEAWFIDHPDLDVETERTKLNDQQKQM